MGQDSSRRSFLKKGLATTAFAMFAAAEANAMSLQIPGRDKHDPKYIGQKGKHFVMVLDLRKCIGCQACTSVCKVENQVPQEQYRTFVTETELGEFPDVRKAFLPQLCNHCEQPACVPVCPTGATFKREDGIVVVDNDVCWGCGYCISACPYDKRYFNERTKTADKCNFCAQRVDKGLLPACVETCVGGARVFGDINDKNSDVYKLVNNFSTTVLKEAQGTKPQTFYISLDSRLEELFSTTQSLDDMVKAEEGFTREWTKARAQERDNG
jgi:tetrathionate reductase subunit B